MMRRLGWILTLLCAAAMTFAQTRENDEAAIRAVLAEQEAAWNRGDLEAFMQAYDDSPETTFIGAEVRKGYEPILERYRTAYANRDQMGTLKFSNLEVRLLAGANGVVEYAIVTGNFHLERTTTGTAKKNDGVFSLVWHRGTKGWKIILDHTS